jgi:hypothetical protein
LSVLSVTVDFPNERIDHMTTTLPVGAVGGDAFSTDDGTRVVYGPKCSPSPGVSVSAAACQNSGGLIVDAPAGQAPNIVLGVGGNYSSLAPSAAKQLARDLIAAA